ncbi:MAG: pseudouridine synthase, partial [Pseudomonadota bacterium]
DDREARAPRPGQPKPKAGRKPKAGTKTIVGAKRDGGAANRARATSNRSTTQSRARTPPSGPALEMRIAKAMAQAGLCSRRDAERWIGEGRVKLNGRVLETAAQVVGPSDKIEVDGAPLPLREPARLWRYHKPKGQVTTHRDPDGRPTVFDALPKHLPRVISVGRLDYNTEGLLLLTNDGGLARHLELPATGWLRRYRVRAFGDITQERLNQLSDGVVIEGVQYGPIEATRDSAQGGNVWLTIGIREGKNREVRKVLESLGLKVNRLIRVSFGPFRLMDLKPGNVASVRSRVLADQLGAEAAAKLGLGGDDTDDDREASAPPAKRRKPAKTAHKPDDELKKPERGKRPPPSRGSTRPKPARSTRRSRP